MTSARVIRRAWYGLAIGFVGLWLAQYAASLDTVARLAGLDYQNYAAATRDWLGGGPWYLDRQLHGPYAVTPGDALYPPTWLLLFVPAAFLPPVVWWAVPISAIVWVTVRLRPAPAAWALMAACLAWPPTAVHLLTGNPGIWMVAALALGVRYRWPAAFVLTKVTIAPLALIGVRDRRWWWTVAAIVAVSLPFASMWPTYAQVLLDARHPAGLLYSAQGLPMLAIPLVAWLGRRLPAEAAETS